MNKTLLMLTTEYYSEFFITIISVLIIICFYYTWRQNYFVGFVITIALGILFALAIDTSYILFLCALYPITYLLFAIFDRWMIRKFSH